MNETNNIYPKLNTKSLEQNLDRHVNKITQTKKQSVKTRPR